MRAVTFQAPMEVRVDERPVPELDSRDDAVVSIEASGICGSDLHIYHGRVKMEPGFTIGHEFVGTVTAAGDAVTRVGVGDRVLGCFHTACGTCFFCLRGHPELCEHGLDHARGRPYATGQDGTTFLAAFGTATFGEETVVPERACVKIDSSFPLELGALVGCLRQSRWQW